MPGNQQAGLLTKWLALRHRCLKGTLHFISMYSIRWHVYNICSTCQCYLYPHSQLPSLLPSSTDVIIIRSSRNRIFRESLAEVRLGFFSLLGALSKICLLWKMKPELWMHQRCRKILLQCLKAIGVNRMFWLDEDQWCANHETSYS